MVHGIEGVGKVDIHNPQLLPLFGCLLKGPMQGLHLALRGVQPAEPLLGGVQQLVPLGQPVQSVCENRR